MTYYTGLARVAKTTGYPVVEVDGWKSRGHGGMAAVDTIVVHHTAGPKGGNYPSLNVVTKGRTGLPGPLCNYGVGRDGTIYVVAAGLAYHAGAVLKPEYGNSRAIGIECENTGLGETWPDVQLDSVVKLCAALIKEFKLSSAHVLGHKEVCSPVGRKTDPNFAHPAISMSQFRSYVFKGSYKASPTPPKATKPSASKPSGPAKQSASNKPNGSTTFPKDYENLAITKKWDVLTVGAHQILMHALGHKLNKQWDGKFATLTVKDTQNWLRSVGYYKVTPITARGVKKGTPLTVDGGAGFWFWYEFQRYLADRNFYKGKLDGDPAGMTYEAVQHWLNTQH